MSKLLFNVVFVFSNGQPQKDPAQGDRPRRLVGRQDVADEPIREP